MLLRVLVLIFVVTRERERERAFYICIPQQPSAKTQWAEHTVVYYIQAADGLPWLFRIRREWRINTCLNRCSVEFMTSQIRSNIGQRAGETL